MNRKLTLSAIAVAMSLAATSLVVVVLGVFSAPNMRLRLDLSQNQINGVSERVLNAIASIDEPVRLTAFLYREDQSLSQFNSNVYMRAHSRVRMLIDDLNARTSSDFSSLVVDENSPLVEQQRLQELHDRQPRDVIVLSTSSNHVVLKFDDLFEVSQAIADQKRPARLKNERVDSALGDAALRLANKDPFSVAVIKASTSDESLSRFLEFIERQGHSVDYLDNFSDVSGQDLVIVAGQKNEFTPTDFEAANKWVAEDRHLLLALGSFTSSRVIAQWNQILHSRGESFGEGLICEAIPIAGTFMEGRSECAILEVDGAEISGQHDLNISLLRSQRSLLFAGTRPLNFGNSNNSYSQSRLLRTSQRAWIDQPNGNQKFARDLDERPSIYSIAIASELWTPVADMRGGRLLMLGSDEVMRSHLDYNQDWLATAILYLLGDDMHKSGMRNIQELPFRPQRQALEQIKALSVYVLPGICLFASILVGYRRKQ
ncbi:MAG: Gldg family protein [Planctomycetota bacterium]|nr:Gldg family protein [Planctomycetota bacterium]